MYYLAEILILITFVTAKGSKIYLHVSPYLEYVLKQKRVAGNTGH